MSFLHKPQRIPGRCEDSGKAWGNPRRGRVQPAWGSCVEARGGRPDGERFVRESFVPRGVERKTWSRAPRSVSDWGGWFTSLVLTEKHRRFADT
eukprot:1184538-Prorocentrum_minimum.AAC.2